MILLYLMYGGPVDILSHILFTFHMIQMAFVLFLIAPLLYFSIPEYLQKYIVSLPVIGPVLRLGAKKPLFSLMLLIAAFSIYHLPVVMDNLKMSATQTTAYRIVQNTVFVNSGNSSLLDPNSSASLLSQIPD